jgi:hypothetical protein
VADSCILQVAGIDIVPSLSVDYTQTLDLVGLIMIR